MAGIKDITDKTREELNIEDWEFVHSLIENTLLVSGKKWVAGIDNGYKYIDYYEWSHWERGYELKYREFITGKKFTNKVINEESKVDLNEVSVLVIDMKTLDDYKEENNHKTENDLSYREAVKLAKGEYSLFDMVRLMNTSPEFQTFDPETNYYIAICHAEKRIIRGSFDLIN